MSRLIITHIKYREKEVLAAALEQEKRICQMNLLGKESKDCILGNVYIGKVKNIAKNIHAAFIDIGNNVTCYYSLDEKEKPLFTNAKKDHVLKAGDELVVQVCREAMKNKLPCVTGNINFTGRYLVLTSHRKEIGFSTKLTREEKKRIGAILENRTPLNAGLIVRTNCREASEEEILSELEELRLRYENLMHKAVSRTCFSLLEESMPGYLRVLQNTYSQNLDEIVTDDRILYHRIAAYLDLYKSPNTMLRLYEDSLLPLGKLYSLETVLSHALSEKVWLKSGGFLVIQQTEAFVSVDVNTGKFVSKKEMQETFRKINLEAAKEIALQLRLRNLSGIILIDFINMEKAEDKAELLKTLQMYLKQDPVKGIVVDITPLNIVEVTRKKIQKSLQEEVRGLFEQEEEKHEE